MNGRLEKLADLPRYRQILTLAAGAVPLSTQRQQHLIALELEDCKQPEALVLATKEKYISPDTMDIRSRLRTLGYRLGETRAASPTLISTLYIQSQERLTVQAERLDNTDIEDAFAHLVVEANAAGASDVHILCHQRSERALVRLRIHGEVIDWQDMPAEMARRLCSSVYNSIAEDREVLFNSATSQDANIHLRVAQQDYHLRYAHAPSHPHGFHAAIRILRPDDPAQSSADLAGLGFLPGQVRCLQDMLRQPDGAIIIAGTTGSGKSTTIRSLLAQLLHIHERRLNILTIEDPPEYRINGVIQSPVVMTDQDREQGRNGFEKMIRSGMRRDPDVLMIGEIRDLITAMSFIHAVQSGHLCLTTLHARDCFSILSRLEGLGAKLANNPLNRTLLCEPGFIKGLIYQRLLPRLCPACSIPQASATRPGAAYRQRGGGCKHCWQGVAGRTVCAEIVRPDQAMLREMQQHRDQAARDLWRRRARAQAGSIEEQTRGLSALDVALYKMRKGQIAASDLQRHFGGTDPGLDEDPAPEAETPEAETDTGRSGRLLHRQSAPLLQEVRCG